MTRIYHVMKTLFITVAVCCMLAAAAGAQSTDPLPSWNESKAKRAEWSYDVTPLGRFEKGLEEAIAKGWTVVDMKRGWKVVYPVENK